MPDTAPVGPGRCRTAPADGAVIVEHSTIFQGGIEYPHYRIPAVATTASGVVLAFAEARSTVEDPGAGRIDVVMRRSLDCGRTWEPLEVLGDNGDDDAHNPTAVVAPGPGDAETVFLFYGQRPESPGGEFDLGTDEATMWMRSSSDQGATWSPPTELTGQIKAPDWRVASFGPGQAIVTRWGRVGEAGAPPGRILVPGWFTSATGPGGTFVAFSDDGGATWARAGTTTPGSEPQLVELTDGSILMTVRNGAVDGAGGRTFLRSPDGGRTWSDRRPGIGMGPISASMLRTGSGRDGDAGNRLLHTGIAPANPLGLRYDLKLWSSDDEGATWTPSATLVPGFVQYTQLTRLDDRSVGAVYETLTASARPPAAGLSIRFARFDADRIP